MVFDRRFTAASPRYPQIRSNGQQQSDGLRSPLQDHCVLLTRSFLMVLGVNVVTAMHSFVLSNSQPPSSPILSPAASVLATPWITERQRDCRKNNRFTEIELELEHLL